jgi:uncharacterized protein YdhG (YjbR/CyaY superfamily)
MAQKKTTPKKSTTKTASKPASKTAKRTTRAKADGFTAQEKAAMREAAKERKTAARRGANTKREDGERDVLEKIAQMPPADRAIAKKLHALVTKNAPDLWPRTWYGMPAYAKDGKVLCYFQSADKFDARYATLGFSDQANLDNGEMWPTSFALKKLTPAEEKKIATLIKKAVR